MLNTVQYSKNQLKNPKAEGNIEKCSMKQLYWTSGQKPRKIHFKEVNIQILVNNQIKE